MSRASEKLERITAEEFKKRVEENPRWAKDLEHPIVVYQYVDLKGSKIEYLSRWLRFSGKDDYGECASFIDCKNLVNAEGTYDGSVDFSRSGIKKIGRIKVLGVDRQSWSAYFYKCQNLTKLSGEYLGPVAAADSTIKEIKTLRISKQNRDGQKLDLSCTMASKIDTYSSQYINFEQIVWDEHIDDPYIKKMAQSLETHKEEGIKEHKHTEEKKFLLENSKKTIVKTIAEAIGADDILVQQDIPITSPKRRSLLKASTLLTALVALFLYKTTDELTNQVLIEPTVGAIRKTPELVVNWIDPKEKIQTQNIWPHEFTPALERYARSEKKEEDKIALAKDTILVIGLKPETLIIASGECMSRSLEINNNVLPFNIQAPKVLGMDAASSQFPRLLAQAAYQSLSAFEDMSNDFKKSEIDIKGLDEPQSKKEQEQKDQEPVEGSRPNVSRETGKVDTLTIGDSKKKTMQVPLAVGIN